MKRWLPLIITLLFVGWLAGKLRLPNESMQAWPTNEFGRIPMVINGRHQPMDTFARNSLMQIRDKQTANLEPWKGNFDKPQIMDATEWALELMINPELGDTRPVFRIDNPDVKGLFGLPLEPDATKLTDGKHFSWNHLQPKWTTFKEEVANALRLEDAKRTPYQRGLAQLWKAVSSYRQVKIAFGPAAGGDLDAGMKDYLAKLATSRKAFKAQSEGEPFDDVALDWLNEQLNAPLIIPAHRPELGDKNEWQRPIQEVIEVERGATPHFSIKAFADIAAAYRAQDKTKFKTAADGYLQSLALALEYETDLKKASREQRFNYAAPFFYGMYLCVAAFLLGVLYWFSPTRFEWARKTAVYLVLAALLFHTAGLIFRYVQEGRPPVTNLYSSAIFIGWAAAIFGLVLEKIFPFSIGVVVAAAMDFISLLIAHHLSRDGDTMVMLQAVLDTNFWLATHVVIITLGYAATFLAGFIGAIYIIRRLSGNSLTPEVSRIMGKMVYAVLCFATLFSFVGTVLGGIWADQSWGRFWGWDVKENGALIIVLWNALILHARWGGIVKERGLMCLAIGGNIVTSWSWFGVNMLGIGLHSYGFMGAAFYALVGFCASQLLLIILACFISSKTPDMTVNP